MDQAGSLIKGYRDYYFVQSSPLLIAGRGMRSVTQNTVTGPVDSLRRTSYGNKGI